jgi:tetratricopeptide (TPR) repeat protein
MYHDHYDLPLSTASEAAAQAFDLAADSLLAGVGNPLAAADAVLAEDPEFALGHSARATALMLAGQLAEAREAAARGVELATSVSRREQQHAAIIQQVMSGRRDEALALIHEHIEDFPRDALAIDPAAGVFGLIGFSGRQNREQEQLALLQPLAPHYGDDWWYQQALAFALLEYDQARESLPLVEAALATRPDSGHVAHIWVHAKFEAGEHTDALAWLTDWVPGFQPDGIMYCHLWWHLALFHLLEGNFDAMWKIFDEHCQEGQSESPSINLFTDGVALTWRAWMAGAERSVARLERLRELGERYFPRPGIFVDVHQAACLAALEDWQALDDFRASCRVSEEKGFLTTGTVVFELADGFEAFAKENWSEAHRILSEALPSVVRIGGSRAQRRLVDETIAAAERHLRVVRK